MPTLKNLLAVLLFATIALSVQAEDSLVKKNQVDVSLLLALPDAGGNDDFHSGKALELHYNYYFKEWLAADVGLMATAKLLDQSNEDIVGNYRASIQTSSILLGLKPRYRFSAPYEVFARLGLLYWWTELEVEEYFDEIIPGGTVSATDNGMGYYLSIGGAHYITDNVMVQLEIKQMKQLDVFEGQTSFPFDLSINAISLGITYRF